ncbi:MAG: DUF3089 domain-containing protein [Gammaproteobacteria bacterium]|nr:DUF3089 domain-containing protein [Gammaproteobacteria bacterium]MCY4323869.1 DUF3089 domain-containing protein [Gammaproteobacteria bacterium]
MQKWAIGLVLALAIIAAGLYLFRENLMFLVVRAQLQPDMPFSEIEPPAAPDYADAAHWAALPTSFDNADFVPPGARDAQPEAEVDVFYLHPTTYFSSAGWNQPHGHEESTEIIDTTILTNQTSVFNGCCAIYAPRYRQATLFSFMDREGDGDKALELAYSDVQSAFEHFLAEFNQGRPFIIAGHSQGAFHSDRLIREVVLGTDLEERLVAAYTVGFEITEGGGLPVCERPRQTGCQVNWNAMSPDATSNYPLDTVCVNPLTWRTDGARADFAVNPGSMNFDTPPVIEEGVADAQCLDGRLLVSELRSDSEWIMPFGEGNYHAYDYGLFYMSIRANAKARVRAYLDGQRTDA